MKKNKGFTLIELLAVIVVLAIIALIATPIVLNLIDNARKGAAKQSATAYVKSIENAVVKDLLDQVNHEDKEGYQYDEIDVDIKGTIPTSGTYTLKDGKVVTANFCISGYNIDYSNGVSTAKGKCNGTTDESSTLSDLVSIGDYIRMTPTSTSYTVPASLTGYDSDQTINPSELNVWRVIKINDDGTIETVSENVSSVAVYFTGQTGYKNLVGTLNTIAKQYENSNYTIGSRHMGYNSQTEYLTDTANTVDSTSTTAPWTCSTGGSCSPIESQGGGDTLYIDDTNLVTNVLGTLVANNPSGTTTNYWLASRDYSYFYYNSPAWYYNGRHVITDGSMGNYHLHAYYKGFDVASRNWSVRPIVTLKSGLTATGSGTSDNPWVLG